MTKTNAIWVVAERAIGRIQPVTFQLITKPGKSPTDGPSSPSCSRATTTALSNNWPITDRTKLFACGTQN
ncbi:hypothetical protein [Lacticaseibacillus pantheris]|uniref:hypothetical protein n=1 Tax=Lacticaseibacillus pantheris TaxID=171523 RepID=UPI0034E2D98E